MRFQFFSIPAKFPEESQQKLNRFCETHSIISLEKEFVHDGQQSYWAILICYAEKQEPSNNQKKSIDYKEVLNESDFALFARLRELRKNIANQQGVPAYALFTNEQLAEMVKGKVTTITALRSIEGIGQSRIEKYGDMFLSTIASFIKKDVDEATTN